MASTCALVPEHEEAPFHDHAKGGFLVWVSPSTGRFVKEPCIPAAVCLPGLRCAEGFGGWRKLRLRKVQGRGHLRFGSRTSMCLGAVRIASTIGVCKHFQALETR